MAQEVKNLALLQLWCRPKRVGRVCFLAPGTSVCHGCGQKKKKRERERIGHRGTQREDSVKTQVEDERSFRIKQPCQRLDLDLQPPGP